MIGQDYFSLNFCFLLYNDLFFGEGWLKVVICELIFLLCSKKRRRRICRDFIKNLLGLGINLSRDVKSGGGCSCRRGQWLIVCCFWRKRSCELKSLCLRSESNWARWCRWLRGRLMRRIWYFRYHSEGSCSSREGAIITDSEGIESFEANFA